MKTENYFKLTEETKVNILGITLFRIQLTVDCKHGKKGDFGGWVQSEFTNSGNARVSGNAWVSGDAEVFGNARVSGDAEVSGNARVFGNARVSGNARVFGNAEVFGNAWVSGDARVFGNAEVFGNAWVSGNAKIKSNNDFCAFYNFGSVNRTTTFFKTKEKNIIKVVCGCFYGTIKDFTKKVKETHSDNKHSKEYLSMVKLVKIKFGS